MPLNESISKDAYKCVTDSLDIVNIIKEPNNLKVLTHLLLKEYH